MLVPALARPETNEYQTSGIRDATITRMGLHNPNATTITGRRLPLAVVIRAAAAATPQALAIAATAPLPGPLRQHLVVDDKGASEDAPMNR